MKSNGVLFEPAGTGNRVNRAEATRLLDTAAAGDPHAAADLLPVVYDQLRKAAAVRMAVESPGHILHPAALVHEVLASSGADRPGGPLPEPFGGRANPGRVIRRAQARQAQ